MRTLAGVGLTSLARGATLALAERVVIGVFGAGVTLDEAARVDSGAVAVGATLAGRALAGGGVTLAVGGRTLAAAAAPGFTAGVALGLLATVTGAGFAAGAGFSATGSSSSQPESMSSSEEPMSRKGTLRCPAYGSDRANRVESASPGRAAEPATGRRSRRKRLYGCRVSGVPPQSSGYKPSAASAVSVFMLR